MAEVKSTVQQTVKPLADDALLMEEEVWTKIMEQNLEGVMFHTFETDLYCLLDLKGFKKMHECQSAEEKENLECLKHKYIETYKKMPILKNNGPDLWEKHSDLKGDMLSHEKVSELVKQSMEDYANWETDVLEHLLKWKRNSHDKKLVHSMIEDVMKEIKCLETLINILEEHHYHYECICEMSDYLCKMYK